jgi:hypothetical protein
MIRALARRLTVNDGDVPQIRYAVRGAIADKPCKKGGIFEALRRSPLVGADR